MSQLSIGILTGMSSEDLRAALASLQKALIDLSSGSKVATAAYAQGDGSRSVTYVKADIPQITAMIQTIQAQLGLTSGRRALGIRFR